MSELRRKMLTDLRIRNYAEPTQKIYITRVAEMAMHFGRSPDTLGRAEISGYLRYLKDERDVSRSAFKQTVGALRFLYQVTLDRSDLVPHIPYPREKRRHPVVLSREEVRRLLEAITNLKHRAIAMVLYGGGLGISEAVGLHVRDIDSDRMVITVRHGRTHRRAHADFFAAQAKRTRSVLASLVRVVDNMFGPALPGRHVQSVQDELRTQMCGHRPPDHPPAPGIDDHG